LWTDKNRAKYDRDHLRYPSDLTDDEWAYVEPLIPPAKHGGVKRRTDMRAVMNGVMYILSTGCQWRYIPKDFPRTLRSKATIRWRSCLARQTPARTRRRNTIQRAAPCQSS
jgi:transposase